MFFNTYYVATSGLDLRLQAKAQAGRLHRLIVTNTNAAVRYCQLFDVAGALPADGATPILSLAIAAGATPPAFDFGPDGLSFANGLWIANSTTPGTKTIGVSDQFYTAIVS